MHIQSIAVHLAYEDVTPTTVGRYAVNDEPARRIQSELGHAISNAGCYLELANGNIITGKLRFSSSGNHTIDFIPRSKRSRQKSTVKASLRPSSRSSDLA